MLYRMATAYTPDIQGDFKKYIKPALNRPHDAICHAGRYIVTDTYNNRVLSINPVDRSSTVLCSKKQGLLPTCPNMLPFGIVALSDKLEDFLFTDLRNRCILRFKTGATRLWNQVGSGSPEIGRPCGITLDSNGQVYVADCDKHCIHVFNSDGHHVRCFGSEHLKMPWTLQFNSDGRLYVTDHQEGVKIFDKDGTYTERLIACDQNYTWTCRGLAVDIFDNIFVGASMKRSLRLFSKETVTVFDRNHKVMTTFGGFMQFKSIRGICFDYHNNSIVVVDGELNRLQVYKLYGNQPDEPFQFVSAKDANQYEVEFEMLHSDDVPDVDDDDNESGIADGSVDGFMNYEEDDLFEDSHTGDPPDGDGLEYDDTDLTFREEFYHITCASGTTKLSID